MHAEALGLSAAASLLAEHLTGLQSSLRHRIEIVFQMDNLPIIQHINGLAKCSHLGTAAAIAQAIAAICSKVSNVHFEYISRESNFW